MLQSHNLTARLQQWNPPASHRRSLFFVRGNRQPSSSQDGKNVAGGTPFSLRKFFRGLQNIFLYIQRGSHASDDIASTSHVNPHLRRCRLHLFRIALDTCLSSLDSGIFAFSLRPLAFLCRLHALHAVPLSSFSPSSLPAFPISNFSFSAFSSTSKALDARRSFDATSSRMPWRPSGLRFHSSLPRPIPRAWFRFDATSSREAAAPFGQRQSRSLLSAGLPRPDI